MPLHDEPGVQKADTRHASLVSITAAMEAEGRAQAASLPPTGKPVAPPATAISGKATISGVVRLG